MNGNPVLSVKPEPPPPEVQEGIGTSQWILPGEKALPASLNKQTHPGQATGQEAQAVTRHFEPSLTSLRTGWWMADKNVAERFVTRSPSCLSPSKMYFGYCRSPVPSPVNGQAGYPSGRWGSLVS